MTADHVPVGRGTIWRALLETLATGRPALVLLAGAPGSGRTHLIRSLCQEARARSFTAIGSEQPLTIEPTTQFGDVSRTITALLGGPRRSNLDTAIGSNVVSRTFRTAFDRVIEARDVLTAIEASAPLLICIDGYTPNAALGMWVRTRLVPRIRRGAKPVMMVFADRPQRLEDLRSLADAFHELGDLDLREVEEHVKSVATGLRPPLSDEEVAAYSSAAARDPSVFRSLVSVLSSCSARG